MRSRVVLTALVVLLGSGACVPMVAAAREDELLASLQVYTSGDGVGFVLQVTNVAERPVELNFRTGQSYDFAVLSGTREVWRWSADQVFTQAVRRERLAPGESKRYEALWRPDATVRGEFVAVGELTASDARVQQSTRIELP
jgi:hypothetical protein